MTSPSDPDLEPRALDSIPGVELRRELREEPDDAPARVWREVGPGALGGMLACVVGGALSAVMYGVMFGDQVRVVVPILRQFLTVVVLSGLCVGVTLGVGVRRVVRRQYVFNPVVAGAFAGVIPGMYGVETLARQPLPFVGTANLMLAPLAGALVLQTVIVRDALAQRGLAVSRMRVVGWGLAMVALVSAVCGALFALGPPLFETLKDIYFSIGHLVSGAVCGALFGGIVGAHTWLTLACVARSASSATASTRAARGADRGAALPQSPSSPRT